MPHLLPPESPAPLGPDAVRETISRLVPTADFTGQRTLLIIPDATRTAPLPLLFDALHSLLAPVVRSLGVLVALGTHPPMTASQLCRLLGQSAGEFARRYPGISLWNHVWDDPEQLTLLGTLSKTDTRDISGGLLAEEVPVRINRRVLDFDRLLVLGPVFPHEVVGFSGGNKYFFPGISGPEILNFFHWLGALITNVGIIGVPHTPVRNVVDRAAQMIPVERRCLAFVVAPTADPLGLFFGTPEEAWREAAALSARVHITRASAPFHTVLSCAPPMYDELWVAGKCMYKLEPVVADGGELIIHAPHLSEISLTHGRFIRQVGYHCRDYFVKQWDRFGEVPRGILAHSTHVYGQGSYSRETGIEQPRCRVTLASQIPPDVCQAINLGYRDPSTIEVESFANRETEGILLVRKAGEMLFRLQEADGSV